MNRAHLVDRRTFLLTAAAALAACRVPSHAGELRLAIGSSPLTLDPRGAFNADTAHVQQLVFNTLVAKGPRYDISPELAESWAASPDSTSHTFTLRPGVRFHDGRELSSRDVAYTFNSLISGGFGKSSAFTALERVEVVGDRRVRFVSRSPNRGLLVDLIAVGVLPDGETRPVGTGAYQVVGAWPGEGDVALGAFPGYWAGTPRFERIVVRVIPDPSTLAASIEAGDVDLAVNPAMAPDAINRLGTVVDAPGGGIQFVVCNCEVPGLADPASRRTLFSALDRRAMVDALAGGRARVASSVLPPEHYAWRDVGGLASGTNGATPQSLDLLVLSRDATLASVVQESWRKIGVEVRIVVSEPATFMERLVRGEFGAAIHRLTGGNQFTTIFKGAFHSRSIHDREGKQGELNYARYASAEADRLIEAADATGEYAAIQRHLAAACPWLLLWHPDNVAVSRIGPVELNPGGDYYFLRTR
jgi:peptide/nickel transport system substrate-binding protein